MDKLEFIQKYHEVRNALGLEIREALVSAGGACLLLGIRDKASDIDLDIPVQPFNLLVRSGEFKLLDALEPGELLVKWNDYVDLHRMEKQLDWMNVEGVGMYPVHLLIEQKLRMANSPHRDPAKVQHDLEDVRQLQALRR